MRGERTMEEGRREVDAAAEPSIAFWCLRDLRAEELLKVSEVGETDELPPSLVSFRPPKHALAPTSCSSANSCIRFKHLLSSVLSNRTLSPAVLGTLPGCAARRLGRAQQRGVRSTNGCKVTAAALL